MNGIKGEWSTKTGPQNVGSSQNSGKAWPTRRASCAPFAPRCGCLRKGSSGLCWPPDSLSQVLSVLFVSFGHHFILIHIYFCPQLSSKNLGAKFFWHCLLETLAGLGVSQGFYRGEFDVFAQESQGARGGSWQKAVEGGHNITSHPASVYLSLRKAD